MNLSEFLNGPERNAWIRERYIDVYVRKANHLIGTEQVPFLDLANVTVDENKRGGGVMTMFVKRLEREAKKRQRGVYVESVLEPRLVPFLTRNGYQFVPRTAIECPSLYKIPT